MRFMELQIFSNSEFGEIRTITKDNETYFVGTGHVPWQQQYLLMSTVEMRMETVR